MEESAYIFIQFALIEKQISKTYRLENMRIKIRNSKLLKLVRKENIISFNCINFHGYET